MIRQLIAALALSAMVAQPALAQSAPCVTSSELHAGVRFVMPILIGAVAKRCGPTLGSQSYLASHGAALAQRYVAQPGDDEVIASLAAKLDDKAIFAKLNADERKAFVIALVGKGVGDDLKPKTCPKIDQVLALLDPMPADNTIGLLEVLLRTMSDDSARKAAQQGKLTPKLSFCP